MDKLKITCAKIVVGLSSFIGILLYILNIKNKKIKAYKAKIELADTKDKVESLEYSIKQDLKTHRENIKARKKLEENLKRLEKKKKEINTKNLSDSEIEDYWKNN